MRSLLNWLLTNPLRTGLVSAVLALSRVFDVFGAALIAVIALRKGLIAALQAIAVALPLLTAAGYFNGLGISLPLAVLGLWIPVLLLSLVLRNTGSLALALQAGAAMVGAALAAWYVADPEPLDTVREFLNGQVLPLLERMEGKPAALNAEQVDALAKIAPGLMAAGSLVVVSLALLVGRWWQAIAFNPGGFQQDFHRLRQGRRATLVIAALAFAALFSGQPVVSGFALAGVVTLIFQGAALAHGVIAATGQSPIWLWAMYGLLVLLPLPVTVLLAVAGGIDNWMDFRRLAGQGAVNSNE